MPKHLHYVEPYAGGMAVLLAKDPEGVSEIANDINGELINFWKVLADPVLFVDFKRRIEGTPFSQQLWTEVVNQRNRYGAFSGREVIGVDCRVMDACSFFVWCRQSLAGRMKSFTGVTKTRTRRGMNNEMSAWLTCIDGLADVHTRLKRVLLLNQPALEVIQKHDGPQTLQYLDPPYMASTRSSPDVYAHEMDVAAHEQLLDTIKNCQGKIMLSGYPSVLYSVELASWNRHDFDLPNNAAGGEEKTRMTECIWCNF